MGLGLARVGYLAKRFVKRVLRAMTTKPQRRWLRRMHGIATGKSFAEIDALYTVLYASMHDRDNALSIASTHTREAFGSQWREHPTGRGLLSNPWFKENVTRIISEEEIQIKPDWFKGKRVLDAGCGNGRWSYGFAKLGCDLTSVDINESAIQATRQAIEEFSVSKAFYTSPMEELSKNLPPTQFDLVFSWGVLHHCRSFNQALDELTRFVKPGGVLYLYLYGRETMPFEDELPLFKERIVYNTLLTSEQKRNFLKRKAGYDPDRVHEFHDLYAPLINRRLEFDEVKQSLESRGFVSITRTLDYTELFIRACKETSKQIENWVLPKKEKPFWFSSFEW